MPDLTPQMERELAELEAALAPVMRETRPAPDDDWVAPHGRHDGGGVRAAAARAAPVARAGAGRSCC